MISTIAKALWGTGIEPPGKYDPATDSLARAFTGEDTDLYVHADICARRYRSLQEAICDLRAHASAVESHGRYTARTTLLVALVILAVNWDKLSPFLSILF
jgi:hypothetical protein